MWEEVIELCERNTRVGVQDPQIFDQLALAYAKVGDDDRSMAASLESRRIRAITVEANAHPNALGRSRNNAASNQESGMSEVVDSGSRLSGRRRRIAAWLVDSMILGLLVPLLGVIWITYQQPYSLAGSIEYQLNGIVAIISPFVSLAYYVFLESSPDAQTIGKRLLRIKVASSTDSKLSWRHIWLRNFVRCAPIPIVIILVIFSAFALAVSPSIIVALMSILILTALWNVGSCLTAMVTPKRQSFHDLIARTIIVE